MSKIEVDTIDKQSGSTLTLGGSGTAVTLASGATQTGFGRTGTVDWQTGSIKTSTFTAASGEGYFCNTAGGAFTVNLPAGSAGAIVSVSDYTRTFQTNNLAVSPNGSEKIGGVAGNASLSVEGQSATFVYVDATEGWINIQNAEDTEVGATFISATGGTVTCSGNCKIHTFTGPGNFVVSQVSNSATNNEVSYLVVSGGGGSGSYTGGGGGAGGFRETKSPVTPYTASPLDGYPSSPNRITVTATTFPIAVGGGGAGQPSPDPGGAGTIGSVSTFSTITSAGGGAGGGSNIDNAGDGGSGGGGSEGQSGGSGNTPSTTPAQGTNGGTGSSGPNNDHYEEAGAGGGATTVGGNGTHNGPSSATGGTGATTTISGTPTAYAGGGGGAKGELSSGGSQPQGGAGGGGNGSFGATVNTVGTINTGGGGGGASSRSGTPGVNTGKQGGSGIVIIRYKFQ